MAPHPARLLSCLLLMLLLGWNGLLVAEVGGIYIRTDSIPDLRDISGFVTDVTAGETSDHDRAVALWGAVVELMPQSPGSNEPMLDDGRSVCVDDPIKLWNVYGFGFCSYDAHALQACFRELGWPARNWEIHAHTVMEAYFDGAWHLFDAAHEHYFPSPVDGHIASREELRTDSSLTFCSNFVEYYPGGRVPPTNDAAQEYAMYSWNNGDDDFLGMGGRDEFNCGHVMDISLKRGMVFTRYFGQRGTTSDYWYGQSVDTAPYWYLLNWDPTPAYGNGEIVYTPAFSDIRYREDILSEQNAASQGDDGQTPALHLAAPGTGAVVFRIRSPYIITSASFSGTFRRQTAGEAVKVYISPHETRPAGGIDWGTPVWTAAGTGSVTAADIAFTSTVRGRYSYLVKIEFTSGSSATAAGVEDVTFTTIVQNALPALPRLAPGANTVTVKSRGSDCIQVYPRLITDDVFDKAFAHTNVAHRDNPEYYGAVYPVADDTWGEIVYRFETPGDVTGFSFGGHFYIQDLNRVELAYSWDNSAYTTLETVQSGSDEVIFRNVYAVLGSAPAGHRDLYLRYRLRRDPAGGASVGLTDMGLTVYHANTSSGPALEITYTWEDGGTQTHTETVAVADTTFPVTTSGALEPTRLQPPFTTFNRSISMRLVDPDTDGDGLPDNWELDNYGDLSHGPGDDTDSDGVTDLEEYNAGTDPQSADSDSDGIDDGDEISAGTSPTDSDTDHDGLDDLAESLQGTDPLDNDTDNDGLLDGVDPDPLTPSSGTTSSGSKGGCLPAAGTTDAIPAAFRILFLLLAGTFGCGFRRGKGTSAL